jgi:hypothetical protein
MSPQEALARIRIEYERAAARHGAFNSGHEGYAVIREELDEPWEEVKSTDGLGGACEEAVQVAAMALRFLVDLPRETKRGAAAQAAEGVRR